MIAMDKHALSLLQLLLSVVCGGLQPQRPKCNETLMLEKLPACGKQFEVMMTRLHPSQWCNLTEFIMYYDKFSQCTENRSMAVGCFWPNSLAERFITGIHRQFFSNCTSDKEEWVDPPDEILTTLILIPVFLTAAMISLVVWCSKRGDIFG
ncbi:receptor activity-modifying protein 3 [Discoglossus pictus]